MLAPRPGRAVPRASGRVCRAVRLRCFDSVDGRDGPGWKKRDGIAARPGGADPVCSASVGVAICVHCCSRSAQLDWLGIKTVSLNWQQFVRGLRGLEGSWKGGKEMRMKRRGERDRVRLAWHVVGRSEMARGRNQDLKTGRSQPEEGRQHDSFALLERNWSCSFSRPYA